MWLELSLVVGILGPTIVHYLNWTYMRVKIFPMQVSGMSAKGSGTSALEGRSGYGSAIPDSAKITTGDYSLSSGHGYGHKSDQLYSDKISGYPSVDRHQYGERQSAYAGRDLQNAPAGRFGDSIGFDNQHKV